jgi:hypothetical protein
VIVERGDDGRGRDVCGDRRGRVEVVFGAHCGQLSKTIAGFAALGAWFSSKVPSSRRWWRLWLCLGWRGGSGMRITTTMGAS